MGQDILKNIKIQTPSKHPEISHDKRHSVEVVVLDEYGYFGRGHYDYINEKWILDLPDDAIPEDDFVEVRWVWFYFPVQLQDVALFQLDKKFNFTNDKNFINDGELNKRKQD